MIWQGWRGSTSLHHKTGFETVTCMLAGGVPLNEPVLQHGLFVMNTEAEIAVATRDYQAGRMGVIEPAGND